MKLLFRYLVADRDRHGNLRVYYRRGGRKIRIREQVDTPEFSAHYHEIGRQYEGGGLVGIDEPDALQHKTLGGLFQQYELSTEFKALDRSTQYNRRRQFDAINEERIAPELSERFQDFPLTKLTLKALEVLRDRLENAPGSANDRVKALRAAFAWASTQTPPISANIAAPLRRLTYMRESHHLWTTDEIERFRATHPLGTKARLALEIMLNLGVRRSDACLLGPQHVRANTITWVPKKNRHRAKSKSITVPMLPAL